MGDSVNPVPEGFHTVTPYVTVGGAADAIGFYARAFGAREIFRWSDGDGSVRHAEVVIGDLPVMLIDEAPKFGMIGPRSPGDRRGGANISREDLQKRYASGAQR